ncbi:sugar transporter [Phreatobacter aquaticus]|uniref:Sugar transporter n=1 Tax=Phreatobacter aquaticus TaxID=2570229 RepID=A0A4D7QQP5_9HYPH|nr:polysaccharide biosynthesis/export family protein [Phreatobacter aquaticus]QCK87829.1 sugar transporter [Phreatobacter aquaticus]
MKQVGLLALALAMAVPGETYAAEGTQTRYLLGPQDRLMIRVHSLRRSMGEAVPWVPLNGEFSIGADGSVSIPIVGQLRAAGGTTSDLAEAISQKLREAANLSEVPSASVEVIKYRPFYVLGAVQQPGKYEFQPGLTVLQALSTAQGLARASEMSSTEREMLSAGGDIRTLEAERISLEARMARLAAEISDATAPIFSEFLTSRASDPRVAKAMQEETLRFTTRRANLLAELEAIEASKVLLQQELRSLDEKGRSLDRQIEANKRELRLVGDLLARGLTVSPRQIAAENTQVQVESNRLDVQVASLRANQSLARASRDLIELRARYRREALDDSAATRSLLDQNAARARTAELLLQNAEARSPASVVDSEEVIPTYRLTRSLPTGSATWVATEDTALEAGDVLQVTVPRAQRRGQGVPGQ